MVRTHLLDARDVLLGELGVGGLLVAAGLQRELQRAHRDVELALERAQLGRVEQLGRVQLLKVKLLKDLLRVEQLQHFLAPQVVRIRVRFRVRVRVRNRVRVRVRVRVRNRVRVRVGVRDRDRVRVRVRCQPYP